MSQPREPLTPAEILAQTWLERQKCDNREPMLDAGDCRLCGRPADEGHEPTDPCGIVAGLLAVIAGAAALPREAGPGLPAAITELERIERELSTPYARAIQGEVKAVLGNWLTGLRSALGAVRASAPASRERTDDSGAGLIGQVASSLAETAAKEQPDYDKPLAVTIEQGALVIRIGVQVLAHAVTYSDWANSWEDESGDYIRTFAIEDAEQFARDVAAMMRSENEDGSSLLSHFLDKASEAAVNDGSLGLHPDEQKIKHGEKSPLETW